MLLIQPGMERRDLRNFFKKLGFSNISKSTFFIASGIVILIALLMLILNDQLKSGLGSTSANIGYYASWFFIIIGAGCLFFVLYIAFSKFGKLKLKTPGEKTKKDFSNFGWASMIFAGGIGAGILWGGLSEWNSYLRYDYLLDQPVRNAAGDVNPDAAAIASVYSIFHWGPLPWAMHASAAIPIAYMYYIKKTPILKISQACGSILGKQKDKFLGKTIDTFFILGLMMACATTLGLGTQTVSQLFSEVAGTDPNSKLQQALVLLIVYSIFLISAIFGLKKGMALLAKGNTFLTFGILIFVLFAGPTLFIVKNGLGSIGNFLFFLPKMITYTDPTASNGTVPSSDFVANWTTFYWAWWGAYVLFMGMFIAKISRGRSLRNMILGTLGFGSLGVFLVFAILGGAGLGFFLGFGRDAHPIIWSQENRTSFEVAADVLSYLPAAKMITVFVFISAAFYMANSFNGATFSMAASTMKEIKADESPPKWLKIFFSLLTALVPLGMIMVGADLNIITAATVIGGIPSLIILTLMLTSWIKTLNQDYKSGALDPWFEEIESDKKARQAQIKAKKMNKQKEPQHDFENN